MRDELRWCCVGRSMAKWCSSTVMSGCLRTDSMSARSISARQILVVEDAVFRCGCLRGSVLETPVGGLVEMRAPFDQVWISSGARRTTNLKDGLFVDICPHCRPACRGCVSRMCRGRHVTEQMPPCA